MKSLQLFLLSNWYLWLQKFTVMILYKYHKSFSKEFQYYKSIFYINRESVATFNLKVAKFNK